MEREKELLDFIQNELTSGSSRADELGIKTDECVIVNGVLRAPTYNDSTWFISVVEVPNERS